MRALKGLRRQTYVHYNIIVYRNMGFGKQFECCLLFVIIIL